MQYLHYKAHKEQNMQTHHDCLSPGPLSILLLLQVRKMFHKIQTILLLGTIKVLFDGTNPTVCFSESECVYLLNHVNMVNDVILCTIINNFLKS